MVQPEPEETTFTICDFLYKFNLIFILPLFIQVMILSLIY